MRSWLLKPRDKICEINNQSEMFKRFWIFLNTFILVVNIEHQQIKLLLEIFPCPWHWGLFPVVFVSQISGWLNLWWSKLKLLKLFLYRLNHHMNKQFFNRRKCIFKSKRKHIYPIFNKFYWFWCIDSAPPWFICFPWSLWIYLWTIHCNCLYVWLCS